nr:hypothetical protein [Mycolicibacterium sediminis]
MSRVPGSDGGAWATDPETNYRIGFVPQGIADLIATIEGFTRDDVDARALRAGEGRGRMVGRLLRQVRHPVKDQNGLSSRPDDERHAPRLQPRGPRR